MDPLGHEVAPITDGNEAAKVSRRPANLTKNSCLFFILLTRMSFKAYVLPDPLIGVSNAEAEEVEDLLRVTDDVLLEVDEEDAEQLGGLDPSLDEPVLEVTLQGRLEFEEDSREHHSTSQGRSLNWNKE